LIRNLFLIERVCGARVSLTVRRVDFLTLNMYSINIHIRGG
jgi:hypothetical protein